MPLFWPFKSRSRTAESYEKELVQLSTKIADKQQYGSDLRMRLRRVKGLVTLYTIVLYMIFLSLWIFNLVPNKSAKAHYQNLAVVSLSPIAIWGVRFCIQRFFDYLLRSNDEVLDSLWLRQKEMVEELKQETKFYSTQALIQRFSEDAIGSKAAAKSGKIEQSNKGFGSKFANKAAIGDSPDQAQVKNSFVSSSVDSSVDSSMNSTVDSTVDSIGDSQQQQLMLQQQQSLQANGNQSYPYIYTPKWYDKILELLVGEDEQSPKNRYALICVNCHNHNGLAQYGEFPEYVVYRCPYCGHVNGREKTDMLEDLAELSHIEESKELAELEADENKRKEEKKEKKEKKDESEHEEEEETPKEVKRRVSRRLKKAEAELESRESSTGTSSSTDIPKVERRTRSRTRKSTRKSLVADD